MKAIISILFLSSAFSAFAGECEQFHISKADLANPRSVENIPEFILTHYQQAEVSDSDFIADVALLKKAQSTPKKIVWQLTASTNAMKTFNSQMGSGVGCAKELFSKTYDMNDRSLPAEEIIREVKQSDIDQVQKSSLSSDKKKALIEKLEAKKVYLEGHSNPVKAEAFAYMIDQIMIEGIEAGITPKYGTIHDWSPEFKASKIARFSVMSKFSKLLIALARGETSQFMLSGSEQELESWILSQEVNSLYPHDVIKASYQINDGDMYLTLLTIENVLNRYWRVHNREDLPVTIRLKPIINSFGLGADNFGSWYHLFGVMLYGYVEGPLSARTIGGVESLGSHVLGKFADEKQEDFINSKGSVIGARLARSLRASGFQKIESDKNRLNPNYYLDLNEDFTKRLEKL